MTEESNHNVPTELKRLGDRLKKIETYLWPPIDPPNKPKGPTDDDPVLGPRELGRKLQSLYEKVDDFIGRAATKEEIEELHEHLAQLSAEITALNDSYELLARHMQVPG